MNKLLFPLLLLLACPALDAEELGWKEAVAQAKASNPALKNAADAIQQARENLRRSYSNFFPQISGTAATAQSGAETGYSRQISYGVNGTLSLFSGMSDISTLRIREAELNIAEANAERTVSDAMSSLKTAFINLLWAQDTEKLSGIILKRRTENLSMIRLKYNSGSEDRGSLMRVEADKLQAEYDLARARRYRTTARIAFLRAMGRNDSPDVNVRGELAAEKPDAGTSFRGYAEQTPEYRAARYAVDKAAFGVTSAKSGFYPSLSLSGGTGQYGSAWAPDANRWNLGLSLSVPLFTGGRTRADVRIADLARTISEQTFRQTGQQLETRVAAAYNGLIDAVDNVAVNARYLSAAEQQSTVTSMKYLNGLASYQDWYVIENDYISFQKSWLNTRREAALAATQWANLLGRNFEE